MTCVSAGWASGPQAAEVLEEVTEHSGGWAGKIQPVSSGTAPVLEGGGGQQGLAPEPRKRPHFQGLCSPRAKGPEFLLAGVGGAVQGRLSFGVLAGTCSFTASTASLGPSAAQDARPGHCNPSQRQRPRALPASERWLTAQQKQGPERRLLPPAPSTPRTSAKPLAGFAHILGKQTGPWWGPLYMSYLSTCRASGRPFDLGDMDAVQ